MKSEDPREVTTPKAPVIYTNINGLNESLEDLNNYEEYTNHETFYNSLDGGRMVVKPHIPFEDDKKVIAKEVKIKLNLIDSGLLENPSDIDYLLEHEEAYYKHLGING